MICDSNEPNELVCLKTNRTELTLSEFRNTLLCKMRDIDAISRTCRL